MERKALIAIDLDGTLLDEGWNLSDFSEKVLRKLVSQGAMVVLASGRPFRSMKRYYEAIGCNAPIITYNGALTYHPLDSNFPARGFSFSRKDVLTIYENTRPYWTSCQAESSSSIYRTKEEKGLADYFWPNGMTIKTGDLKDILQEDAYAFVFASPLENQSKIRDVVESCSELELRAWSNSPYSELHDPRSSKGSALRYLMEQYGIQKEDCYAFGDSDNDYSMLMAAGHPYAMKNTHSSLLKANFPSTEKGNAEDGVALLLQKLFRL